MRVGLVGTGAIGLPIAEQIIKHGFELSFYARRENVVSRLKAYGAKCCRLNELGRNCDLVIFFLNTYDQCLECLHEVIREMDEGIIIIGSTISPDEMQIISEICARRGVDTVAAPVTGGVKGAEEGTLTIMTSGKSEIVQIASPVLYSYGSRLVYAGEDVGAALVLKLLVQLLVGINTLSMSEAMVLGTKNGLDPKLIYDTLCVSAGTSRIFENRGCTVIKRDFHTRAMVDTVAKDIKYCTELARKSGVPSILGQDCANVFQIAQNTLDDTTQDFSAIIQVYEKWAKVLVKEKD